MNPDYEELPSEDISTEREKESEDEEQDVVQDRERRRPNSTAANPIGRGRAASSGVEGAQVQKKKVGRPIAFQGDVNAPHLTEAERRRLRRCVCVTGLILVWVPRRACGCAVSFPEVHYSLCLDLDAMRALEGVSRTWWDESAWTWDYHLGKELCPGED
jgi:hypothetical protein